MAIFSELNTSPLIDWVGGADAYDHSGSIAFICIFAQVPGSSWGKDQGNLFRVLAMVKYP